MKHASLARHWLWLGITSLAIAGLYAILIVALRTPGVQAYFPHQFFRVSLIVHVNLSVLVWLLSMTCTMSAHLIHERLKTPAFVAMLCSWAGMLLMVISPFIGRAIPITNNYVPMLHNVLFMLGLGFMFASMMCHIASVFLSRPSLVSVKDHGMMGAMILLSTSLLAFTISHLQLDATQTKQHDTLYHYYEMLFWGGGHLLQFVYTQIAMVAWAVLLTALGRELMMPPRLQKILLWCNVALGVAGLGIYAHAHVHDVAYITGFTHHMRFAGGIIPLIWLLFVLVALTQWKDNTRKEDPVLRGVMIMSLILFAAGGILGYAIHGSNVVIPAHYHGSIIGISLILMGMAYHMIPSFGGTLSQSRWARWQPYLYGGGQLLHITGLAWSGGYGALRKTAGEPLAMSAKMGMGLMGMGGLISIIGGIVFVALMVKPLRINN